MKKTYYFQHDFNSRNDSKIMELRLDYGMEGVGIFWCIVEMLFEEDGYITIDKYKRITFELQAKDEMVKNIIENYGLFQQKENCFFSESVLKRIRAMQKKSKTAKDNISKRWEKLRLNNDTNVLQTNYNGNTNKKKNKNENKKKNDYNDICKEVMNFLNLTTNSNFKHSDNNYKFIIARLNEDFTLEDFKRVIEIKNEEWGNDPYWNKFLRPQTLFSTKFESYLNQKSGAKNEKRANVGITKEQIHQSYSRLQEQLSGGGIESDGFTIIRQ